MIRLGLFRGPEQCPTSGPRIFFAPVSEAARDRTLVLRTATPTASDPWELCVPLCRTDLSSPDFGRRMAAALVGLRLDAWWLDAPSLGDRFGGLLAGLTAWGDLFWPQYREQAVVFCRTGEHRPEVYQAASAWCTHHVHVGLDPSLDLGNRMPPEPVRPGRVKGLLAFFSRNKGRMVS